METLNRLNLTDLITASRAHAHTARRLAKAHRHSRVRSRPPHTQRLHALAAPAPVPRVLSTHAEIADNNAASRALPRSSRSISPQWFFRVLPVIFNTTQLEKKHDK